MATYKLSLFLRNPSNDAEFLLLKHTRPPKFGNEEYDSYVDSNVWDLASAPLNPLTGEPETQPAVQGAESCSEKINLAEFDLNFALNKVLREVGVGSADAGEWRFHKYVEEAAFGPGAPIDTIFIEGKLFDGNLLLQESCKWMSVESCQDLLVNVKPGNDRVGPLVVIALINDCNTQFRVPPTMIYQEYPPGVLVIPMDSKTAKPFRTTNLIVFAPENKVNECLEGSFVASGDALIVDPGCRSEFQEELRKIVSALPRKLIVFVTHHHHDHVDGLSTIQKYNPDATLLAHTNTMARIKKDDWSLGHILVSGGEDICIGGQRLNLIFAPGHTDGHMALLHNSTNSLIVGDHCLGQGSAILDIDSGGNIAEYYQSTYKFMELSPHVLIPMHGRLNLWPKHLLCGYLRNRRSREEAILKAIEGGAKTLYDIVANVYSGVDRSLWVFASWNVRVHVEHLAQLDKLPKGYSIRRFQRSCNLHFFTLWALSMVANALMSKLSNRKNLKFIIVIAGLVAAFASSLYTMKDKVRLTSY